MKGGGKGGYSGRILVLEQYVEDGITTNHHTKFKLDSSKHLEVIPSWKMNKNMVLGG